VTVVFRLSLLVVASVLLSACTPSDSSDGAARSRESGSPSTTPAPPPTPPEASGPDEPGDGSVQLQIIAGDLEIVATLRDTPAARDLLAQLPLTLSMRDHGGVEKTGSLPEALSLADAPDGADPNVADLGYYAPSNDLVLYYGDQSYYQGIVILGHLQGDVGALAEVEGDLKVQVRRLVP
jgi:hypothetical protein